MLPTVEKIRHEPISIKINQPSFGIFFHMIFKVHFSCDEVKKSEKENYRLKEYAIFVGITH